MTISAASAGWFETSIRWLSFSHQRKAGMKLLLPCRMPAWLADVCEGSSAVHLSSFIWPERIQLASERHPTGTDLVGQDGLSQAVDLDDDHARLVAHDAVGPAARQRATSCA